MPKPKIEAIKTEVVEGWPLRLAFTAKQIAAISKAHPPSAKKVQHKVGKPKRYPTRQKIRALE